MVIKKKSERTILLFDFLTKFKILLEKNSFNFLI